MEWALTDKLVLPLAVLGAVLSVAASVLQLRASINASQARWLNGAGYALMACSMGLFVVSGFRAQ